MGKIIFLLVFITNLYSQNILTVSQDDVRNYLFENYSKTSLRQKHIIYDEVIASAREFKINPIWIFAILHTESTMRPWITHSQVQITIHNKLVKTKAVGIGGVIYEIWKDPLEQSKIIETKGDLYDIRCNIRAVAYIFSYYKSLPQLGKTKTQEESALLRYYGVNYNGSTLDKYYYTKINQFLASIARYSIKD